VNVAAAKAPVPPYPPLKRSRGLLPERQLDQVLDGRVAARDLADHLPVPEHGRAVADPQHLAVTVADEDDPDALVAQPLHDPEQPLDVGLPERGRRLVEDEDARPAQRQHLRDLDELALRERDLPDLLARVDRAHAHAGKHLRAVSVDAARPPQARSSVRSRARCCGRPRGS
jgi:hypothetical protein